MEIPMPENNKVDKFCKY